MCIYQEILLSDHSKKNKIRGVWEREKKLLKILVGKPEKKNKEENIKKTATIYASDRNLYLSVLQSQALCEKLRSFHMWQNYGFKDVHNGPQSIILDRWQGFYIEVVKNLIWIS